MIERQTNLFIRTFRASRLLVLLFCFDYLSVIQSWSLQEANFTALSLHNDQIELNFLVAEGVPIGTLIGVIKSTNYSVDTQPPYLIVPVTGDSKSNNSGVSNINIGGGSVDTDLKIDQSTGEIRSAVLLDREKRSFYSFIAIPISGANIKVTITIEDINDNAPQFPTDLIELEFPENSKPRDVKRTLPPAKDLDLDKFGTQKYWIVSGNIGNAFRLLSHREKDDNLYPDLQVNGVLDRETVPNYTLVIEAIDGGQPPLRSELTVRIAILDHNDCEPVFSQTNYQGSVLENATIGYSVLRVTASDADQAENGLITYSLHSKNSEPKPSNSSKFFDINKETGWIFVTKPLDFESKEVHELVVVARDSGAQPLETSAFVSIRVIDVNDNQPTISLLFLTENAKPEVPENSRIGDLVARISVNDADSFEITGPFEHKTETARGLSVSLTGHDGSFSLTTQDSIIYLIVVAGPLDKQRKSKYTLTVTVTDQGSPPLNTTTVFDIKIVDAVNKDVYYYENSTPFITDNISPEEDAKVANDINRKFTNLDNDISDIINIKVTESAIIGQEIHSFSLQSKKDSRSDCFNGFYVYYNSQSENIPFMIDSQNGPNINLLVSGKLDYETINKYSLIMCIDWDQCAVSILDTLTATQIRRKNCKQQIKLNITVLNDENDCEPFPKQHLFDFFDIKVRLSDTHRYFRITDIFTFNATNCNLNKIRYDIISPFLSKEEMNKLFSITGNSLQFRPFDYSLVQKIRLEPLVVILLAKKGNQVVSNRIAKIRIVSSEKEIFNIKFINDDLIEVYEDCCKVGTNLIQARINISHEDFVVKYKLHPSNEQDFQVNSNTGMISLLHELDSESRSEYKINVTAILLNVNPIRSVSTLITIRVLNGKEEPPTFVSKYEKEIIENTNSFICKVEAKILRKFKSTNFTYLIPEGYEYSKFFKLNKFTGDLYTAETLDREFRSVFKIPIYAFTENYKTFAFTYVTVKVIDVNDNPPYFAIPHLQGSNLEIKIPENISPGTIFYTVVAMDKDLYGEGASKDFLDYKIFSGNEMEKFSLNHKGELSTTTFLDREKQSFYNLEIEVDDGQNSSTCNLTIELLDVNDNSPVFDRPSYHAVIDDTPGNITVVTIRATDLDGDEILYSINTSNTDSSYFQIDPKSGEITTQSSSLSFVNDKISKTSNLLTFDVLAIEVGKEYEAHTSKATVHVTLVNNQNTVAPKLKSYPYVMVVDGFKEEYRVGSEIGNIELASGEVSESNIFRIINNGENNQFMDYFYVNSQNGKILVKRPLNSNYYEAIIEVTKGINNALSTRSLLQIFVGKVDNRRVISSHQYKVNLEEKAFIGSEIINLSSKSRLDNQLYSFEIAFSSVSSNFFHLDKNNGKLTLRQSFDNEKDPSSIEVIIFAKKLSSLSEGHYFIITISLLNDKNFPPSFTQKHYISTVKEGDGKGTFVAQVNAIDIDFLRHANLNERKRKGMIYHIVEGNHDNAFVIDPPGSGIVKTNIVLDREIRDYYLLKIVASNADHTIKQPRNGVGFGYQLTSHCTLEINVIDVNDNVPVFPPYQEITISEDLEVGSVISTLTANDVDTYPMLTYHKKRNNKFDSDSNDFFEVGLYTGKITVKSPLNVYDKEKNEQRDRDDDYKLNILASDSLHTVETQVLIKIQRNEARQVPVFANNGNFYIEINQEKSNCPLQTINCEIIKVPVLNGENSHSKNNVIYWLGPDSDAFYIDQHKGVIFNNKTLKSNAAKIKNLIVYAKFQEQQAHSHASVVVRIPKFEMVNNEKNRMVTVEIEKEMVGSTILKLPKTDQGYYINDQMARKFFSFVRNNEMTLINTPSKNEFNFNIMPNSSNSNTSFLINVKLKSNHENNIFKSSVFNVNLSEDMPIGREVYTLKNLNSEIAKYTIICGNELNHFKIDESSGIIYVNANLNYNHINYYQLGISTDEIHNLKRKQSFVIVNINLISIANQCPKFSLYHYKTIVDENLAIGSKIIKILATEASNRTLNYTLIKSKTANSPFEFDYQSGYLVTTGAIDYENIDFSPPSYKMTLRAFDNGKDNFCSSIETLIEIQIGSVDEYPPRFTSDSYKFKVQAKSGLPNVKVGQVLASDADSGPDGQVVYALRSSSPSNTIDLFNVHPKTGEIMINTVGFTSQRHFSLIISASSGRPNSLSVLTVIEVTLTIVGHATDIESMVKTDDIANASISNVSPTLPGWILFLIVLLMLITVVLLVSIVVMRLHQQQQLMVGHNRHLGPHNNIRSLLRKIGPNAANSTLSPYHHHNGSAFVVPGTVPPPCYNDVTLSSSVVIGEGHSASSGRGSAEDEDEPEGDLDDVDEEIRMINEGGDYFGDSHECSPNEEVTSTAEYLARLGVMNHQEAMITLEDDEEEDVFDELGNINSIKATNLLNSIKSNRDSIRRCINQNHQTQECSSLCGSLSSIVHSQEELSGSYNWDYLQQWGPKYQPLASIFAEIAKIKGGDSDNDLVTIQAQIAAETSSIISSSTESSSHHHGINRFGTMSTSSPSTIPKSNACYQPVFCQVKSNSISSRTSDNNSITTVRADDELRI